MKEKKQDILFVVLILISFFIYPLPENDLTFEEVTSVKIFDRNGYLLREILSPQEGRGQWTPLEKISPRAIVSAVTAEDKRFYDHHGVDPMATLRAITQNLRAMETVSGGSTITQQVIRNVYHFPRNILFKLIEMWYAVRLEHTRTKNEILEQYFNRIPFGNQAFGIEAAAQLYFGKSSSDLSWAESAFLIALPKSPTFYNPYKNFDKAQKRQHFILSKLREAGHLSEDELQRALNEPIVLFPKTSPFNAPHFINWILKKTPDATSNIHTTLDLPLQKEIEKIVTGQIRLLSHENVTNAAVLVVQNSTGSILAMCGSADYFSEQHDGQFNAVFSKRQPGSALKPFTYSLAFEKGFSPASLIPDVETVIPTAEGNFTPKNYDHKFHGPVRARVALACSYNVPAVRILQTLGVDQLLGRLRVCGITTLDHNADYYGHGLTLGNGEVTLFELTQAYTIFPNQGRLIRLHAIEDENVPPPAVITSPQTAFLINDILSDAIARVPAFGYESPIALPFPCAAKTGTSSDFRDNWTFGYTNDFTVGVWVGNFDNSPMNDISGVTGAGPIMREIMLYLYRQSSPEKFPLPSKIKRVTVCGISGELSHEGCASTVQEYFIDGSEPLVSCRAHSSSGKVNYAALSPIYAQWNADKDANRQNDALLNMRKQFDAVRSLKIVYPADGTQFKIDPDLRGDYQAIYFEALAPGNVSHIRWYLNGKLYEENDIPFKKLWRLKPGQYVLRAESFDKKLTDEIRFEVLP
ncbi:penicillin-binding protein 1C [bacterium]|nr:penicillin-binding protein 1C [bacterium]